MLLLGAERCRHLQHVVHEEPRIEVEQVQGFVLELLGKLFDAVIVIALMSGLLRFSGLVIVSGGLLLFGESRLGR